MPLKPTSQTLQKTRNKHTHLFVSPSSLSKHRLRSVAMAGSFPASSSSSSSLFLFFLCFFLFSCCRGEEEGYWSGMFVFGGSLVANGNNNYIRMAAKANYHPYGVDFPKGATGRFTNGRTFADAIGEKLKIPVYVPAFGGEDHAQGGVLKVLRGMNYAAGGSGILDATGTMNVVDTIGLNQQVMETISLNQQIRNFETVTIPELKRAFGKEFLTALADYLFLISTGADDFLLNYIGKHDGISTKDFVGTLISTLTDQLKKLYGLGGRKFVLTSILPMGCFPVVRWSPLGGGSCVDVINSAAELFNSQLKSLIDEIQPQMPSATLVYVNSYKIIKDIIDHPSSQGFKETKRACCELPSNGMGGYGMVCGRGKKACQDRDAHLFWDGSHPTQAVNQLLADKAFDSNLQDEVYPINIKQLLTKVSSLSFQLG